MDAKNPISVVTWLIQITHIDPHRYIDPSRSNVERLSLKKVKRGSHFKLVPIKVYPYQSLKTALTKLVQKPGFLDNCEKWELRTLNIWWTFMMVGFGDFWTVHFWQWTSTGFNHLATFNTLLEQFISQYKIFLALSGIKKKISWCDAWTL